MRPIENQAIGKFPAAENQNLISPHLQTLHRMLTASSNKVTLYSFSLILSLSLLLFPSNRSLKKKVSALIQTKYFEYFIVSLIVIYTLIVFVNFGIDNGSTDSDTAIQTTIFVLSIAELVILVIFVLEITANIYVYSIKNYFRDRFLLFDALIIAGSIALVITDFTITDNPSFTLINKIIRGIFRFFRIFLLFRKVNQFNRIKVAYSRYDVKSPVEKIIEILKNLQQHLGKEDPDIKKIGWCIEVISSNRLYDPILENLFKENSNQKEMLNWLANFSIEHQKKNVGENERKPSVAEHEEWRKKRNSILQLGETIKIHSMILDQMTIPPLAQNFLDNVDELEFNVFEFVNVAENEGLTTLLVYLFEENDLFDKLNIDFQTFFSFIKKIQAGYLNNPYHNYIHAADVTQTVNFLLKKCKFAELSNLTNLETASMYIAASIHDFEHNGMNNAFHIATKSSLAIRYNDRAVLENHHISAAFLLTQKENFNIFAKFSREDYAKIRERIVSMVLSTDMSTHFNDMAKVKGRLATSDFNLKEKDKNICMDSLLHAADISNPIKPFEVYFQWTERVLEEFFHQGDEERRMGLPISYLMDRYTVNTSKSQIGFIDVIVLPMYEVIKAFLPVMQRYIVNLESNKTRWREKIEEYDEKLNSALKEMLQEKKNEEDNSKAMMAEA